MDSYLKAQQDLLDQESRLRPEVKGALYGWACHLVKTQKVWFKLCKKYNRVFRLGKKHDSWLLTIMLQE